ncbi:efflux RND transporter periplasmic adaptor subunit [Pseudomonas sp. HK3]
MELNRSHYLAVGASCIIAIWMLSGVLSSAPHEAPLAPVEKQTDDVFAVQVERYVSDQIIPELTLHGETQANRHVNITSEVEGKVVKIHAREGDFVKKDQLIIEVDPQDKPQRLKQAQAQVKQRELEYAANEKLIGQGLQNKTRLAESEALLEAAKAQVKSLEIDITGTQIRAPFDGILENRTVEVGTYLRMGTSVISVMDFNPFIIKGYVAEKDLHKIRVGAKAKGKTLSGLYYTGKIRYVSSQSYQASRTFAVELEIKNPSERQVNGVSAQIMIPLEKSNAILVTPALLSLNESGVLGAKYVNDNQHVEFAPVELVKAQSDGVWISGLPNPVDLIITGQSFVSSGEKVKPVFKKHPIKDIQDDESVASPKPLTAEAH